MLNTQTQLLKQQQEILNENQRHMAQIIKNMPQQSNGKLNLSDEELNKHIMKELIRPVNKQVNIFISSVKEVIAL